MTILQNTHVHMCINTHTHTMGLKVFVFFVFLKRKVFKEDLKELTGRVMNRNRVRELVTFPDSRSLVGW